jgi:multidrug resistance efflux pump
MSNERDYSRLHIIGRAIGVAIVKRQDRATVGVLPEVQQTLNWLRLVNRFQVRTRLDDRDAEHLFRMGTTAVVTILGFTDGPASATSAR